MVKVITLIGLYMVKVITLIEDSTRDWIHMESYSYNIDNVQCLVFISTNLYKVKLDNKISKTEKRGLHPPRPPPLDLPLEVIGAWDRKTTKQFVHCNVYN